VDFIRATKINIENRGKLGRSRVKERSSTEAESTQRNEGWDQHFNVDPWSIFLEFKGHPMLKKPQHMATPHKACDAVKYCGR